MTPLRKSSRFRVHWARGGSGASLRFATGFEGEAAGGSAGLRILSVLSCLEFDIYGSANVLARIYKMPQPRKLGHFGTF